MQNTYFGGSPKVIQFEDRLYKTGIEKVLTFENSLLPKN